MKKSKAYFKLITCLILCATLFTSLMLTGCGNKNNTQPTNVPSTEAIEPTIDNNPEETKEKKKVVEETVKVYSPDDITIIPISQYETKEKRTSNDERDVIITCFLMSGEALDRIYTSYSGLSTKNDIESYNSGEYVPYYSCYSYELNSKNTEEPNYITVIEMEKGYFELSDFKYHFKLDGSEFDKDFSFDGATTDVLKPYIKDDNIYKGDVFVNEKDLYYVSNMYCSSDGLRSYDGKKFSIATLSLELVSLTNDKTMDVSYHYDGKEDFSNVNIKNSIKSNSGVNEYLFDFEVEKNLFSGNLAIETTNCSFKIEPSDLKIIGNNN